MRYRDPPRLIFSRATVRQRTNCSELVVENVQTEGELLEVDRQFALHSKMCFRYERVSQEHVSD